MSTSSVRAVRIKIGKSQPRLREGRPAVDGIAAEVQAPGRALADLGAALAPQPLAGRQGLGLQVAEDVALRNNRLALLSSLHGMMNRVADISKLAA